MKFYVKKILLSLVVVLLAILSATSGIENVCDDILFKGLSRQTNQYLNETMVKAGASYGMVRLGNSLVSVIQETEIGIPATGTAIAFGQLLDPVNDILERTSVVMTISLASLGIQKILVKISAWLSLTILLTVSMAILLIGIWLPHFMPNGDPAGLVAKCLLVALLIYFFVPLAYYANGTVYRLFMEKSYEKTAAAMENFNKDLKEIQEEKEAVEKGFWDKFNIPAKIEGMKKKFEELKTKSEAMILKLIHLMVIFVLQTVLIPILFLWLLIKAVGFIFGNDRLETHLIPQVRRLLDKRKPLAKSESAASSE
ncbi:MAG: hypothetical protein ACQERN_04200 [Thermodesulfobacteriota bacterium]